MKLPSSKARLSRVIEVYILSVLHLSPYARHTWRGCGMRAPSLSASLVSSSDSFSSWSPSACLRLLGLLALLGQADPANHANSIQTPGRAPEHERELPAVAAAAAAAAAPPRVPMLDQPFPERDLLPDVCTCCRRRLSCIPMMHPRSLLSLEPVWLRLSHTLAVSHTLRRQMCPHAPDAAVDHAFLCGERYEILLGISVAAAQTLSFSL